MPELDEPLLMEFAAGSACDAERLLVACHATVNPRCRARIQDFEALGGALLDALEPSPLDSGALDRVMALVDAAPDAGPVADCDPASKTDPAPNAEDLSRDRHGDVILPTPLRAVLGGGDVGRLAWAPVMRGLDEVALPVSGARAKLLRIQAGAAMPVHTHVGTEHTLVLAGSFSDGAETYARGDLCTSDHSHTHRPTAGPEEACICLVVMDAPVRLTGPIGRFLNRFVKF